MSNRVKVIFENPEICNFGEQGVWFGYESEGYDDIVTNETINNPDSAAMWLQSNYDVISYGSSKIEDGRVILEVEFAQ